MNPEFRLLIFCLFTFWVFLPGKSLPFRSKYTKNANITNHNKKIKKSLPGKNTQKVNKQKISCQNWGFVLVVRMSWMRY
jgi:hypothetical protein